MLSADPDAHACSMQPAGNAAKRFDPCKTTQQNTLLCLHHWLYLASCVVPLATFNVLLHQHVDIRISVLLTFCHALLSCSALLRREPNLSSEAHSAADCDHSGFLPSIFFFFFFFFSAVAAAGAGAGAGTAAEAAAGAGAFFLGASAVGFLAAGAGAASAGAAAGAGAAACLGFLGLSASLTGALRFFSCARFRRVSRHLDWRPSQ